MTDLNSDDQHPRNPRYINCEYPGACYFLKVSSSWERLPAIGSVAKLQHFVTVRRYTFDVIGQWPDLTWEWKKFITFGLNNVSHTKFQLFIANDSGAIARKSSHGGGEVAPSPRPARVKTFLNSLNWLQVKKSPKAIILQWQMISDNPDTWYIIYRAIQIPRK